MTRPLMGELRATLWLFAALAFVAGVLLFVLGEHTNRFFSWTIKPPLSAAFLGASYWAAVVLIAWSARRRSWADARAAMPPVLSIATLLLLATLIHIDRFHLHSLFGWFWVIVYGLVPPALVLLLWRQLRVPPARGRLARSPLPARLRLLLAAQALIMVAVGSALFVAPTGAGGVWPWSLTPLTARAIGAFVFGFGVAAAHATVENDLERFRGPALAYATLGLLELVALVRYTGNLTGASADTWIYAGFLTSVVLVGSYASLRVLGSPTVSSASAGSS